MNIAKSKQEKRLQQIENSSRSLHTLGEQSSVYIPISSTPIRVPPYLTLDGSSQWVVGALQAVALESMTLSSRLRSTVGGRGNLQDLEETFNSTGKRRIAKLEMSIADPDVLSEKVSTEIALAEKAGSVTSRQTSEEEAQLTEFDIDAFTKNYRIGTARTAKRDHVFGRAEATRGEWNLSEGRDPHDRFNDGPTVHRYVALMISIYDSTHCPFTPGHRVRCTRGESAYRTIEKLEHLQYWWFKRGYSACRPGIGIGRL